MAGSCSPLLSASEMVITLPGTFIVVLGHGVLLQGPSGIGKSDLALALIDRGHSQLVADDSVTFYRDQKDNVDGYCPPLLQDFLEIRGLGILNMRQMFGDQALCHHHSLNLLIQLTVSPQLSDERLRGHAYSQTILNLLIPSVTLSPQRNLPLLIEAMVRNHALRTSGYDASQDFQQRQHQLLGTSTLCD
jgi:HPr kinase/phosphorylase